MKNLLVSILLGAATPALAQGPAAAPAAQTQDASSLAIARHIVGKMLPDGIYGRLMRGPMDQMMRSMTSQMLNVPIRQFLSGTDVAPDVAAKLNDVALRDVMAILDPSFDRRAQISMSTMMAAMGDLLTKFEPQLREAMAQAYVHNFSPQELGEIDRFFDTPTGNAYAGRLMTLMSDPSVQEGMKDLMPALMKAMPAAAEKVQAAIADLPKPKKIEDLSDAERVRMGKLLGVNPAELRKAKSQ